MAKLIPGSFSRWELTEQEQVEGCLLNQMQIQNLQNRAAAVADQILALIFGPQNPQDFIQQDSFLKGQLEFVRWQLASDIEIREALRTQAQNPEN